MAVRSRRNKTLRSAAALGAVFLFTVVTGAVAMPSPAQATPADCDGNAVVGRFTRVGSGASFNYNGRVVELQNESLLDTYSRAEIKSGRQAGDQVWIDRSHRRFSLLDSGIVSHATATTEGWKQCGPFSGARTQSVNNSVHAARACARMDGVSRCGAWYVD